MFKGMFRYLATISAAAVLALTLAACGGDEPKPTDDKDKKKDPVEVKDDAKKDAKADPKEDAKEVAYKCTKCSETKNAASGAPAPS